MKALPAPLGRGSVLTSLGPHHENADPLSFAMTISSPTARRRIVLARAIQRISTE